MKIRLVASEFFSWGLYGGYGYFTRKLGKELVKRGIEVDCIVKKVMPEQKPVGDFEYIDGVKVITVPRKKTPYLASKLFKTDADLIHSECGMLETYLAFKENKNQPKILSIQDLRTKEDLSVTSQAEPKNLVHQLWENWIYKLYGSAMRDSDVVAPQAELLLPKIRPLFGFDPYKEIKRIEFLYNFVDQPRSVCKKDSKPNIVFLGRLDPIKNPELCFSISERFPEAQFYILGKSTDNLRDNHLRAANKHIPNLHFIGLDNGKRKHECLSKAWILINTSIYEALPVSFIEAMAYKCAIISMENPDGYTSKFGYVVSRNGNLISNYIKGLKWLISNDNWKYLGEKGYELYRTRHTTEIGVQAHIDLYKTLIESNRI